MNKILNFIKKIFNSNDAELNLKLEDAQQKLAAVLANQSKLEAVLGSMFDGVMVVDQNGNILLINQTLKDLWNVSRDPIGHKPLEIIRNIEIQQITDTILRGETVMASRELSVLVPEEKFLEVHATPVMRDGRVDGAVLVFHDITKLRHLERIRRDFVANVSHELRTPIATIKGYAETLLDGALDDKANAKDFIQIIYSDSDRLAILINDLLELSQIESGNMNLSLNECSLEMLINRAIKLLQPMLLDKSITIKFDVPVDFPKLKVDETSIVQVFLNLIENAIKYNKPQGSITISAYKKDPAIVISISDTGIGIPEEDLPRIFERFYRVDKARSRQLGGTGLGLSIVKHIIQAHNGEMSVRSELGQGSTFTITLPQG